MSHYHIIGIAGAGMSAIAHLLLDQGHTVSGSDLTANRATAALAARGAQIWQGHDAAYVRGADFVLATAAIRGSHPELEAAATLGIPRLSRADLWRAWSAQRPVIAVAGTHGKTTTSAMTALALRAGGVPCGFLIGAEAPDLGGSAQWGDPAAPLVIEADEYDRVFLALTPAMAIVTNVEWDHPDIYPSAEAYAAAFATFAGQVRDPRRLLLCADDPGAAALDANGTARLYGIDEQIACDPVSCRLAPLDWTASRVTVTATGQQFDLWYYDRRTFARRLAALVTLAVPGLHNVRNATAAVAAAALWGADLEAAVAALATYRGSSRRFELRGAAAGVTVIDDYAHHPTEVQATVAAAHQRYPGRRVIVYVQPHTFSRTRSLWEQWPNACRAATVVVIGDVYPAREQGDPAALATELAAYLAANGIVAHYAGAPAAAAAMLTTLAQPGDVVLTLGAGDSDRVAALVLERLQAAQTEAAHE
ncbi:UDP-N-acetylmuramate--L-alanine ligase [Chloroflexus sp.]|uniref:UDP-N-acetylmuramate--L-alanine ligase n=1 Tax=Chloroflexus sp. TaxID=1904827 RepID=UPI00298F25A6|nr:UDP-N-acetylmuramate--L-alanine ligase [Chloroflexus sp.]MDW8403755.1 UDP-N-acetylmuramate--L-alanine ligase [Chloroflexus sp.]